MYFSQSAPGAGNHYHIIDHGIVVRKLVSSKFKIDCGRSCWVQHSVAGRARAPPLFGLEKGGARPPGGPLFGGKRGARAPLKSQTYSGDGLRYVFLLRFWHEFHCKFNKEGPQCKKNRLRRATAAQRPSIVRKPLYMKAPAKKPNFRQNQGGPAPKTWYVRRYEELHLETCREWYLDIVQK